MGTKEVFDPKTGDTRTVNVPIGPPVSDDDDEYFDED